MKLLFGCIVAFAFGAAPAFAQDKAFTNCLDKPEATDTIAKECTVVIESSRASPLDKAIAYNNRAIMAADTAHADREMAVKLAPKIPKLWHNRGTGFLGADNGGTKRAIEDFSVALKMDPAYAVAWTSRGEAWQSLGDHDKAIADFDQAIRLAPRYMHAMYNPYESRARSREAKGDAKGAAADRRTVNEVMGTTKAGSPGVNATGIRVWEPFIAKRRVPKEMQ